MAGKVTGHGENHIASDRRLFCQMHQMRVSDVREVSEAIAVRNRVQAQFMPEFIVTVGRLQAGLALG